VRHERAAAMQLGAEMMLVEGSKLDATESKGGAEMS